MEPKKQEELDKMFKHWDSMHKNMFKLVESFKQLKIVHERLAKKYYEDKK